MYTFHVDPMEAHKYPIPWGAVKWAHENNFYVSIEREVRGVDEEDNEVGATYIRTMPKKAALKQNEQGETWVPASRYLIPAGKM